MHIREQHLTLAAFATLAAGTAFLIWLGMTEQQLPEWLLAITTFL